MQNSAPHRLDNQEKLRVSRSGSIGHMRVQNGLPGHMIAALLELNHGLASVAALPPFPPSLLEKLTGILILGTATAGVPSATTGIAHLGLATATFTIFATILAPADVLGLNPLVTTR